MNHLFVIFAVLDVSFAVNQCLNYSFFTFIIIITLACRAERLEASWNSVPTRVQPQCLSRRMRARLKSASLGTVRQKLGYLLRSLSIGFVSPYDICNEIYTQRHYYSTPLPIPVFFFFFLLLNQRTTQLQQVSASWMFLATSISCLMLSLYVIKSHQSNTSFCVFLCYVHYHLSHSSRIQTHWFARLALVSNYCFFSWVSLQRLLSQSMHLSLSKMLAAFIYSVTPISCRFCGNYFVIR